MKPETLVKLSVALLSEAEQEFRYKANECLYESTMTASPMVTAPKSIDDSILDGKNRILNAEYDKFIEKADAILEAIDKLNKI